MTNYYATAFKTGSYPNVTEDKLYLWARPHPKDASAPDSVGKPDNYQLVSPIILLSLCATPAAHLPLAAAVARGLKLAISFSFRFLIARSAVPSI